MDQFKQFKPPQLETFNPVDTVTGQIANSASEMSIPKDWRIHQSFFANRNDVHLMKGQKINRTAVFGSAYTAASTDYLIGITSLVLAPTIGLPRPKLVGPGKTLRVKDEVGGAATTTITVRSQGEETIDGSATSTITTNYGARAYYTDGTNWFTY